MVIAVAFIGPLRDPVKNVWVIDFGMIACAAVIPLALICGPIRGIPFWWQLIDCSFGVVGIVPLTGALNTLPAGAGHREDVRQPTSIVRSWRGSIPKHIIVQ